MIQTFRDGTLVELYVGWVHYRPITHPGALSVPGRWRKNMPHGRCAIIFVSRIVSSLPGTGLSSLTLTRPASSLRPGP
jgi:hypothetical protein